MHRDLILMIIYLFVKLSDGYLKAISLGYLQMKHKLLRGIISQNCVPVC